MLEDINVLEDLKRLRAEVETLTTRVAALEEKPAPAPSRASAAAARARAHDRPEDGGVVDREGGRHRSLDRRQAHRRAALDRREVARTAAKPRSTAAKPRSTAAKKPASS